MRIQVLGELRVADPSADRAIGRGQAREVLAILVAHRDQPLDTDSVAHALWGDRQPLTAPTIVHGAVARLRRALGAEAIVRTDAGYLLDPATEVDLWAIRDLMDGGRFAEARARLDLPVFGRYADRAWAVDHVHDLLGRIGRPADPVAASGRLRRSPAPVTRLIGRRRELQVLREAVRRSRLVTIVGLGGIGKSRLATELVVDPNVVQHSRVVRADLAQAPGTTSARLAAELGVATLHAADGMAASASVLAGPPTLLVLDGCEHDLEDAADAVTYLLERCPALQIVATSRVALGVAGEHVVPVLPFTDPGDPLGDATELLLDRTRALGLPVDAVDREVAAAICERCAGVPLAIEMASSQLLDAPPGTGASLDGTDGSRGPGHDQTSGPAAAVVEAITAAVASLGPATAVAARRAALLPAGVTTALLREVADDSGTAVARELLASGIAAAEGTGHGRRLRFPDPVREQLVAQATDEDLLLVATRLEELAGRCRTAVLLSVDLAALAQTIAEIANIAGVLDQLARTGHHQRRLDLALACSTAWREDGHWNVGSAQLSAALEAAEATGPLEPARRAEVVLAIVTVGGTFEMSARWAEDLRTAAEDAFDAGLPDLALAIRVRESNGRGYAGDFEGAVAAARAARAAAPLCESPFAALYVDSLEASGRMLAGQPERAYRELAALGQIATGNGGYSEAARAHRLASIAARTAGDLDTALTEAEIAEEQAIRGLARGTLAVVRGEIADLRFLLDPASARPALVAALETGSAAGEVRLAGVSRLRLGLLEGDCAAIAAAAIELLTIDGRWASLAMAHLYGGVPARHRLRRLLPKVLDSLEWGAPLSPADDAVVAAVPRTPGEPPATWKQDLVAALVSIATGASAGRRPSAAEAGGGGGLGR